MNKDKIISRDEIRVEFNNAEDYIFRKIPLLSGTTKSLIEKYVKNACNDVRVERKVYSIYTKTKTVVNTQFLNIVRWENENKKRRLVRKNWFIREILRDTSRMVNMEYNDRIRLRALLSKLPRNSLLCRVRNRDPFTGYPRSYFRILGVSRFSAKELGHMPGLVKATW